MKQHIINLLYAHENDLRFESATVILNNYELPFDTNEIVYIFKKIQNSIITFSPLSREITNELLLYTLEHNTALFIAILLAVENKAISFFDFYYLIEIKTKNSGTVIKIPCSYISDNGITVIRKLLTYHDFDVTNLVTSEYCTKTLIAIAAELRSGKSIKQAIKN
jgi:hypothetical protein